MLAKKAFIFRPPPFVEVVDLGFVSSEVLNIVVNLLDHFVTVEGSECDLYDLMPFLMLRRSGRRVAKHAAVIPKPTSTVLQTAILSM